MMWTLTKKTQKWHRLVHLKKKMARLPCAVQEEVWRQRNETWRLGNKYSDLRKGKKHHTGRTTENKQHAQ
eukprot:9500975-Ditylum_brightwellii.AAC.1